jgi:hypothetical protein
MTRIIRDENFDLMVKDDGFDFGFTAVTADELEEVRIVRNEVDEIQGNAWRWQQKANSIYNAVMPLLNNLASDTEKDYIYWPDRTEKIEMFKRKLLQILEE